jgi:hypothetical protein
MSGVPLQGAQAQGGGAGGCVGVGDLQEKNFNIKLSGDEVYYAS